MRDMRMPKGWILIGTNDLGFGNAETKAEKIKRARKFDNAIRNVKVLSYEDLEKQCEKNFKKKNEENAQLLQAYEDKKLKSKEMIKKARALKNKNKNKKKDAKVAPEAV